MDLSIGATIKQLRKEMNITQEDLAVAVGISAPAVSKWESGKAYPDITLLPSIARQLKTTVDNLLSFTPELSATERNTIIEKCYKEFDAASSFESALASCEEHLHLYPHDDELKLHIGTAIAMYANRVKDEDTAARCRQKAIGLCKIAADAADPKIRTTGLRMLANIYLIDGQLDLAEQSVRECIVDCDGEYDPTLAVILLQKGELEKAEDMYQRCLFRAISNCESALFGLAGVAKRKTNDGEQLKLLATILSLSELFELDQMPGFLTNVYLDCVQYYASKEMPDETLNNLKKLVESIEGWSDTTDLSSNSYFHHLSSNGNVLFSSMTGQAFSEIAEMMRGYEFLSGNPHFLELLDRLANVKF